MEQQIFKILYNNQEPANEYNIVNEENAAKELAEFMAMKCIMVLNIVGNCFSNKEAKTVNQIMNEVGFTDSEINKGFGLIELEDFS